MKGQTSEAPVPIQMHQDVLDYVECMVMTELSKAQHAWSPAGTRVTYALAREADMPPGQEYRLERGNLTALNQALRVEMSEKAWQALLEEESDSDVLTIAFVDALHKSVQTKLEAGAKQPLVVGVAGVLTGSTSCWGTGCWCTGQKGYYRRCRLVCTAAAC